MDSLYLRLDAAGGVVGSTRSPDPQPDEDVAAQGLVPVDADTFDAGRARVGRCRLVDGALADYDPPPPPADPPPVSGDAIVGVLSKAQASACDVRDLARIAWRDDVPATNAKLGRIAKAAGMTPASLWQAASTPPG